MDKKTRNLIRQAEAKSDPLNFGYAFVGQAAGDIRKLCATIRLQEKRFAKERDAWLFYAKAIKDLERAYENPKLGTAENEALPLNRSEADDQFDYAVQRLYRLGIDPTKL
jgi:hypothetical protein